MTEEKKKLSQELQKQVIGYILGAFGLVAGLAWNEAIRGSIEYLYPLQQDSLPAKFIYAGCITVLLVILSIILTKVTADKSIK